ncbi:MAG: TetR/AcrR family transcriptional regulator [Chloroflexota bacterium]
MTQKQPTKKLDRRVRRTRQLLSDALFARIVEQGYEQVSIQDITDHANLNRATFYLHYNSKEELLIAGLESHFDQLVARIDSLAEEIGSGKVTIYEDPRPILWVFQYVERYAKLYKVLLSESGTAYIVHLIIDYITNDYEETYRGLLADDDKPTVPISMLARANAGSLFALLSWWVMQDMPHTPEVMTEMFYQICRPTLSLLGIQDAP